MKTLDLSQVSFFLDFPLCYIFPYGFTNSDKGKTRERKFSKQYNTKWKRHGELIEMLLLISPFTFYYFYNLEIRTIICKWRLIHLKLFYCRLYFTAFTTVSMPLIVNAKMMIVHMAHPNGRVCGAKRPKCEAERSHHLWLLIQPQW